MKDIQIKLLEELKAKGFKEAFIARSGLISRVQICAYSQKKH